MMGKTTTQRKVSKNSPEAKEMIADFKSLELKDLRTKAGKMLHKIVKADDVKLTSKKAEDVTRRLLHKKIDDAKLPIYYARLILDGPYRVKSVAEIVKKFEDMASKGQFIIENSATATGNAKSSDADRNREAVDNRKNDPCSRLMTLIADKKVTSKQVKEMLAVDQFQGNQKNRERLFTDEEFRKLQVYWWCNARARISDQTNSLKEQKEQLSKFIVKQVAEVTKIVDDAKRNELTKMLQKKFPKIDDQVRLCADKEWSKMQVTKIAEELSRQEAKSKARPSPSTKTNTMPSPSSSSTTTTSTTSSKEKRPEEVKTATEMPAPLPISSGARKAALLLQRTRGGGGGSSEASASSNRWTTIASSAPSRSLERSNSSPTRSSGYGDDKRGSNRASLRRTKSSGGRGGHMSSDKAGTKMYVVLKDRDDLKTIQNTFNSLSTRHQNELKKQTTLNAARFGRVRVCCWFVERKGANPNMETKKGFTLLHYAAYQGNEEFVVNLLRLGADTQRRNKAYQETPVETAVSQGHFKCAQHIRNFKTRGGGNRGRGNRRQGDRRGDNRRGGGRRRGGRHRRNDLEAMRELPRLSEDHLRQTKNAWSKKRSSELSWENKVQSLLNKVTPKVYDSVFEKIVAHSDITQSWSNFDAFVRRVVETAIRSGSYAGTFARLCVDLSRKFADMSSKTRFDEVVVSKSEDGKTVYNIKLFGSVVLDDLDEPNFDSKAEASREAAHMVDFMAQVKEICQENFEDGVGDDEGRFDLSPEMAALPASDLKRRKELIRLEQEKNKAKDLVIGNITFMGELFKLKQMPISSMHGCIGHLLQAKSEKEIVYLKKLLESIGGDLDQGNEVTRVDKHFETMKALIADGRAKKVKIEMRLIFDLEHLVELREVKNWGRRTTRSNPYGSSSRSSLRGGNSRTFGRSASRDSYQRNDRSSRYGKGGNDRFDRRAPPRRNFGAGSGDVRNRDRSKPTSMKTTAHAKNPQNTPRSDASTTPSSAKTTSDVRSVRFEGLTNDQKRKVKLRVENTMREIESNAINMKEGWEDIKDLPFLEKSAEAQSLVISTLANLVLDSRHRDSKKRATAGELTSLLLRNNVVAKQAFDAAIDEIRSTLDDIKIDVPKAPGYFAEFNKAAAANE